MRHMVVELQIVVQNRKVRMVELEEVLQCARGLVFRRLDIVDLDRMQIHSGALWAGEI